MRRRFPCRVACAAAFASILLLAGCVVYVPRDGPDDMDALPAPSQHGENRTASPRPDLPQELIWPVDGPILSGFGAPRGGHAHQGIDVRAPRGTPVRAAAAGRVIRSGSMRGYGNVVAIDHGDGLETRYAHTAKNLVRAGDWVERGDTIALVGATGNATTPHLHFEVRKSGRARDPVAWLPAERRPVARGAPASPSD
jgi:murein DD-endopeptidase MepM/ murein hydrolase activator NlpD